MSIWYRDYSLDDINALNRNTLGEHLEIVFSEIGEDYLVAQMPVDRRTVQPGRWLHGGASAALAEHAGSIAANLCVEREKYFCVGQEINASHLRPVPEEDVVSATVRPLRLGRKAHVWEIRIADRRGRMVCVSRLTMAVVNRHG
ncbi:MAG: hotdog fold thioesterase [Desulfuromonadales bacterium]|nr:hotdog fold thioesterase [Desulfuromonadales bacterium]NIR33731.1 hotdog fold thioesterase [Desulfuromonadales bacterium]NIS39882.1 hotdog fold thioesterase [Desulfuromonadales bacterium]